jgi:hypothetical protein
MVVLAIILLHHTNFFHWTNYIILIVYLGGLLVLFLYFTRIANFHIFITLNKGILFALILLFISVNPILEKNVIFFKFAQRGVVLFSYREYYNILIIICLLLFIVLIFLSLLVQHPAPIRQT